MSETQDKPAILEGIRDDGTIEDPFQDVETYYCRVEAIYTGDGFLGVIGNHGSTNVELRVLFETLEANGWIRITAEDHP
jgi:hypothetical protein